MKNINKEEIYKALNSQLLSIKVFESFKWVKSKSSLISKNKSSKIDRSIEFDLYETVRDADSDELGYDLTVILGVRFNILYKWFEKFYKGSIKDLRNRPTFLDFIYMSETYQVFFSKNGLNFDNEIEKTTRHILEKGTVFFESYSSLEQVHQSKIEPILTGGMESNSLDNWFRVFEYLAICKIVEPQNFDKLEVILFAHFKEMNDKKEPNVIKYFPIYRGAIDELKKIKLS